MFNLFLEAAFGHQMSCLGLVIGQHLLQRGDKGAAFVFRDATEHAGLTGRRMRPQRFRR